MIEDALLETPTARAIVRKAGLPAGSPSSGIPPDVWGEFTLINHEALGYQESYTAGAISPFPAAYPEAMDRLADWSGITEARLLVTVTQAGNAGSYLAVNSDEALFEPSGLICPLDSAGVHLSAWCSVNKLSGDALHTSWIVDNPGLSGGTFAVGLCQIQAR